LKCSEYEIDFKSLVEEGKFLDAFYISTRYSNVLVEKAFLQIIIQRRMLRNV